MKGYFLFSVSPSLALSVSVSLYISLSLSLCLLPRCLSESFSLSIRLIIICLRVKCTSSTRDERSYLSPLIHFSVGPLDLSRRIDRQSIKTQWSSRCWWCRRPQLTSRWPIIGRLVWIFCKGWCWRLFSNLCCLCFCVAGDSAVGGRSPQKVRLLFYIFYRFIYRSDSLLFLCPLIYFGVHLEMQTGVYGRCLPWFINELKNVNHCVIECIATTKCLLLVLTTSAFWSLSHSLICYILYV